MIVFGGSWPSAGVCAACGRRLRVRHILVRDGQSVTLGPVCAARVLGRPLPTHPRVVAVAAPRFPATGWAQDELLEPDPDQAVLEF